MGRELIIYIQKHNRQEHKWEMLPLKKKEPMFDKEYRYTYFWYCGGALYEFLRDNAYYLEADERKYLEVTNSYDEDGDTDWYGISLTKLQYLSLVTRTKPLYEDDYNYVNKETHRQLLEMTDNIKAAAILAGEDFTDSDDIRAAFFLSY